MKYETCSITPSLLDISLFRFSVEFLLKDYFFPKDLHVLLQWILIRILLLLNYIVQHW